MRHRYIGDRAFYRRVFGVAVPIIIQNGISNFVSLLDNIMVGQVGTVPMSGVSIVNVLLFVFNLCVFGASSGAGIFTAQFYGSKDDEGIRHTFRFKFLICIVISLVGAAIFLLGGLMVLAVRIKYIPATFGMIFKYAFEPQAIVGGTFGYAIKQAVSQGAKRGLFSNEAGMGSTPHAHAQANVATPHDQGVVAMVGVFIDTFVVLTLNALVIICTLYTADGPLANGYVGDVTSVLSKTNLAQTAFGSVMGASLGAKFVAICLFFFAFSTVLSWNLFGKINAIWLFGKKDPKACTVIYTLIALVFILMGTMMSNDLVWELTDMFNNLMVIPNVIALFALTKMVVGGAESKIAQ